MSSEYISKIIRRKLTENDGINRDDIINVLNMQSKNMYLNIEEYQKLINDCVISYLTYNKNGVKFLNPKIFDVFQSLASSYKIQGDFEKVKDVYEKSLKIKSLENTLEYKELKNNYEKFLEFMEMKQNFEDRRFDNFESLMNSLTTKFSKDIIFTQGKRIAQQTNQNLTTSSQSNYVMPVEKKLEGFKKLVTALKRYNKDYDIIQCEVGNDAYDGYVILKIENANVSILENFNEVNARIFVVKNEMIDQVRQLTRNDAIALDGVEGINHIENFDNYCRNLIKKTTKLIRETQVGIALPADDEIVFDDNILDKIISDEQKTPIKVNNEVTDIKNTETENEPKKTEKSSIPDLDKVEMERKKAHENRKRLQELEQTLAEIQKNTNKKIADIVNQSEHSQD